MLASSSAFSLYLSLYLLLLLSGCTQQTKTEQVLARAEELGLHIIHGEPCVLVRQDKNQPHRATVVTYSSPL